MRFFCLLCILTIFGFPAQGSENSPMLSCQTDTIESSSAVLDVDVIGLSKLRVSNSGGKFVCDLKLKRTLDQRRSTSSSIKFVFEQIRCTRDSASFVYKDLLEKLTLVIGFVDPARSTARLQWVRSRQPDVCTLKKMNMRDVERFLRRKSRG